MCCNTGKQQYAKAGAQGAEVGNEQVRKYWGSEWRRGLSPGILVYCDGLWIEQDGLNLLHVNNYTDKRSLSYRFRAGV